MRRPVRTIAARCAWAAILFVICFSGTLGAGDAIDADGGNILSSDEQELLEEYYQAARNGNYPAAWSCVERMFDPAEHSRTLRLLDHCRSDRDCPRADFIAWVLGKSKSDLLFMDWFCPEGAPEEECRYWQDWRSDIRVHLGETRSAPAPVVHKLGFQLPWAKEGDMRPMAIVQIGGKALWAAFDTAASRVGIPEPSARFAKTAYEWLEKPRRSGWHEVDGRYGKVGKLVLRNFHLGSVAESRVPAQSSSRNQIPFDRALLGMAIFLRYNQACFSWSEQMLHLGHLGPCAEGETPFKGATELRRGIKPYMQFWGWKMGGELMRILVDTGAPRTLCMDRFVRQMGERRFRFGEHPDMEAECVEDESLVPSPNRAEVYYHALIGMDTLIKFEAFGWELNPFRMYFVPKNAQKQGSK